MVVESQRGNYFERPYKSDIQKAIEGKRKVLTTTTLPTQSSYLKPLENLTKQATQSSTPSTNQNEEVINISTTRLKAVVDELSATTKSSTENLHIISNFTTESVLGVEFDEIELSNYTVPANYDGDKSIPTDTKATEISTQQNFSKSSAKETPVLTPIAIMMTESNVLTTATSPSKPVPPASEDESKNTYWKTSTTDYAGQAPISDKQINSHTSGYKLSNIVFYENKKVNELSGPTTNPSSDMTSTTTDYPYSYPDFIIKVDDSEPTETNTGTTNTNEQVVAQVSKDTLPAKNSSRHATTSSTANGSYTLPQNTNTQGKLYITKNYGSPFTTNTSNNLPTNTTQQIHAFSRRRKRQTEPITDQEQKHYRYEDNTEAILGEDNQENRCVSVKELEEHTFSERKHLDNLRKELDKLESLVNILKEQQRILNSLNKIDDQYSQNQLPRSEKAEEKHIIYLLEDLGSKVSNLSSTKLNQNSNTIEEILNLKQEVQKLRNFVDMHMQSKIETDNEKELAVELQKQQQDIADIKITLQDIIFATKPLNTSKKSLNATSRLRMSEGDVINPNDIQREINGIQRQLQRYLSRRRSEDVGTVQENTTQNIPELVDLRNNTEEIMQFIQKALREKSPNDTNVVILKQQQTQLNEIKRTIDDIFESEQIFPNNDEKEPVLGLAPLKPIRLSFKKGDVTFHDLPTKPNTLGKSRTAIKKSNAKSRGAKSNNSEVNLQDTLRTSEARSSDTDDLKKLLREIDLDATEEDLTSSELESKIRDLEKQLKSASKRKKKTDLETQIKFLQRQVKQMQKEKELELESKTTDSEEDMKIAIKKVMHAIKKLDNRGRGLDEDNVESELKKLQQAIDNLRGKNNGFDVVPKADETAQFQIMLNKILSQQGQSGHSPLSQPSQPVPNQQQMQFLANTLIEMQKGSNSPNVPYGNAGFYKGIDSNSNYFQPNNFVYPSNVPNINTYQRPNPGPSNFDLDPYQNAGNGDYTNQKQQLFRGYEKPYGEDYVQGGNGEEYGGQKLGPNADQAAKYNTYAKQSIEGLKQQIHDLQNIIANLNSPTYAKKPEDEATIYKLDQQINDLKNVVNNLDQYPEGGNAAYSEPHNARKTEESKKKDAKIGRLRKSRSTGDEKTGEVIGALSKLFQNALSDENEENHVEEVLQKASQSDAYENAKQKLADLQKQLGMSPWSNFINN